jgi:hypothetical protein
MKDPGTSSESRIACSNYSIACLLVVGVLWAGGVSSAAEGGKAMTFELKSAAFYAGGDIPRKSTCDGLDVSPPLSWGEQPAGTRSISLIVDESDAPVAQPGESD